MKKQSEIVTGKQWDSYAQRVYREQMKRDGHSVTASTIARRAGHLIIEIYHGEDKMLVRPGWREAMRH